MSKIFVIGLTGQTGSGKSTLCDILKKNNIDIIDCDKVAREIMENNSPVLTELAETFGEDILKNGELDRKILASRAFKNHDETIKLNNITHPAITKNIQNKIFEFEKSSSEFVVLDAPTLFEAGADKFCDYIVCVIAKKEKRLERIMLRDNISKEMALSRMNAQKTDNYYIDKSDFSINNNDGISEEDVKTLLEKINLARGGCLNAKMH